MITPEIDDYIKKTLQIKNPVYFRKLRGISHLEADRAVFNSTVNQDENILAILIVDIILNSPKKVGELKDFKELSYAQNATVLFQIRDNINEQLNLYINNIFHLVQSESIQLRYESDKSSFSVGYIKISQKT